jgi:hypothetical protein
MIIFVHASWRAINPMWFWLKTKYNRNSNLFFLDEVVYYTDFVVGFVLEMGRILNLYLYILDEKKNSDFW